MMDLRIWSYLIMVITYMQLSEGCIPPPPPRCVGKPSETQFTREGEPCIFPFKYESKEYSQCAEFDGFKYCATEIHKDCTYKRLGFCAGSGFSVCRKPPRNNTKINGGGDVGDNSVPFQVGIFMRNTNQVPPFCGGTIIGRNWILSAAHCTEGDETDPRIKREQDIQVTMGVLNWAQNNINKYDIDFKIPHPNYRQNGGYDYSYDILLLWKRDQIIYSPSISSVALPPINTPIPIGQCASVSGWGYLNYQDQQANAINNRPQNLQRVRVGVIRNEQCGAVLPEIGIQNTDRYLCTATMTSYQEGAHCKGDSGGPLYDPRTRQVFGVIHASFPHLECRSPSIYIRIASPQIYHFIHHTTTGFVPPGK